MQNGIQAALLSGLVQMCGSPAPQQSSTYNDPDQVLSCEEYQIIMDVELMVAVECDTDSDCDQILISGDETCESNSILVHNVYESEYFYGFYDEAISFGCEVTLEMNQDCSNETASCDYGVCAWR